MIPLDPTALLVLLCALAFCGGGGYLLGYLEGRAHRRREDAERERPPW